MPRRTPLFNDGFASYRPTPVFAPDMPLTEKLPPRPGVIYCVSWEVDGQGRFGSEYKDLSTAQWNANDIGGYEHISRVRIEEIHEDRELRQGVFPYVGPHNPPSRFNREDPI